jgi:hypothetical protein
MLSQFKSHNGLMIEIDMFTLVPYSEMMLLLVFDPIQTLELFTNIHFIVDSTL